MQESSTNNNSPAISIIIAAYNAERYIKRCIESIRDQSYSNFEVIVINDGSDDCTGTILDDYASLDKRIHVIHQANQGVAAARQAGLNNCKGKYTIHIDSDDWIDHDMLDEMFSLAESSNADMVISDFLIIHGENNIEYRSQQPKPLDSISVLGQMLFDLNGSLCNKLIKRSCIVSNDIRFERNLNFGEDQLFVLKLLSHRIKVAYINKAYYHYDHTQNTNSACNRLVSASDKLKPIELIAQYTDISPIKQYYDRAIFLIAYEYLLKPYEYNRDYQDVFAHHKASIRNAIGFPFHYKLLILLRLNNIRIPLYKIKRVWKLISKK